MLGPIPPREGAAKACAAALRSAILRGELPSGARLPPERSLAGTLGVNRATVRTALRELEAAGLVDVRQGSGYAVRPWRASGGPDLVAPLVDLARGAGSLAAFAGDLLLVRRHLARAVLERLAIRRLGRAAATAIGERIDALEAAGRASAPVAALAALDLEVLGALLDATGSPVLRLFFNPAAHALAAMPELAAAMYADPLDNAAAWRALVAALAAGALPVDGAIAALAARDEATVARLMRADRKARRA